MHVALNAQLISGRTGYRSAGVSTYSARLLEALGRLAGAELTLTAFVNDPDFHAEGVANRRTHLPLHSPMARIAWEQTTLPLELRRIDADLVHGLVNVLPLWGPTPGVVTVHDLSFVRLPQVLPAVKRAYLTRLCAASCRRARRVIAGLAVALILSLSGVSLFNYYRAFQKEEWATAAAYVAERAEPGDMLVFNATWVQLPFAYYFRHYDTATELHGAPVDLFDRGVLEPKMTEADVPHLRALVADADRVWLVYSHEWYTDPDGIIPRELGTLMQQTDRESFEGLQVLTFARP